MTENTATLDSFEIQTEHRSLWVDVWRQFRKHKGALVGMFVFILITFVFSLVRLFMTSIRMLSISEKEIWDHHCLTL